MPLFMLLSGYLFYFSIVKYSSKSLIINKVKQLIIPVLFWSVLTTFLDCLLYDRKRLHNLFRFGVAWVNQFIGQFWFLWAVFICSVAVVMVHKFLRDSIVAYVAVFVICFITPDVLLFSLIKFMYPFFVFGYLFNKYKMKRIFNRRGVIISFSLSVAVFIVMIVFCKENYFIYISGFTLLGKENIIQMLYIDMYRMVMGLLGSFIFVLVFCRIEKYIKGMFDRILLCLGKNTMGIYIISFFFSVYVLPFITADLSGINYLFTILETILVIAFSMLIIFMLQKTKWTNRLLLGNWK